jgi:hypothetical protein
MAYVELVGREMVEAEDEALEVVAE